MSDQNIPLAEAITKGLNDHHDRQLHEHRAHRQDERKELLEILEGEGVEAIRQILGDKLDCSNLPPEIAALVNRVCAPTHQAEVGAIAGILIAIGYIIAQALLTGPAAQLSIESMKTTGDTALDPILVANAMNQLRITPDEAVDLLSESGVRGVKVAKLSKMIRHSLTPDNAVEAFNRRIIDFEMLLGMLQRNGLDDESIDVIHKMLLRPIDVGTAVAAVTQSQIDMETFERLLTENGVDPTWSQVIFKTAGASPSVQETLELWNRGLIDEATVDKIVLESPIKNEYVPVLKLMRHRFPALEQTTTLMRRGIMTLEEGKDAIRKLGYTPELADKMADYAASSQSGSARNLTVGQMTRLFEMGRWDAGTFTQRLIAAGFDPDEAADIVDIAEEGKAVARIERGANSIGTRYVSWKIDRQEAVTLLDRINVPAATRDEMLEVWDARREAQTLHLTEAFLHKAHKAGAISREDVERRLLAMGYDAVDTAIIMATDFPVAKITAKQRDLTRADHVKRYEQGLITVNELRDALTALGYDADEVAQIIELSDKKLSDKAAKETASNGA